MKDKFKISIPKTSVDVSVSCLRLPGSLIPHHHGSAAVLSCGNNSFKSPVFHWVIFYLNSQAFVGGDVARSLGHGPTLQNAIPPKSEVIVKMRCGMLLDAEGKSSRPHFAFARSSARLGSDLKVTH